MAQKFGDALINEPWEDIGSVWPQTKPIIPEDNSDADVMEQTWAPSTWIIRKTFLELESKVKDGNWRARSKSDSWLVHGGSPTELLSTNCSSREPSIEIESAMTSDDAELTCGKAMSIMSIQTDYSPTYYKPTNDEPRDYVYNSFCIAQPAIVMAPTLPVVVAPSMSLNTGALQLPVQAPSSTMLADAQIMSNPTVLRFAMLPVDIGMAACSGVDEVNQVAIDLQHAADEPSEVESAHPQENGFEDKVVWLTDKQMKHDRNECIPCFYFAFRPDGCWKGDDCEFCHLCDKKQCRKREKERSKAIKREKRENGIVASVGQPVMSATGISA